MTTPNDPEQPERPEVYAFPHLEMDPETFGPKRFLRSDLLGMPNQDPFKPAPAEYTAKPNVEARLLDELRNQLARRRDQLDKYMREASTYGNPGYLSKLEGKSEENERVLAEVQRMKETFQ